MIQELRDITNTFANTALTSPKKHISPPPPPSNLGELITLNLDCVDFKQCIPGTVHQRRLGITLKKALSEPIIVTMNIICQDEHLNELPEYIFGVRKENSNEYFDEFRFKAIQKGTYNFVIGVKTPVFPNYPVTATLQVAVDGLNGILQVPLRQTVGVPTITCNREMVNEDGFRMIKLAVVKNKPKKDTKVTFKCPDQFNFTLLAGIIGLTDGKEVEVKPKMFQINGKGMFVLNFSTRFPQFFHEEKVVVRKVLVLQIKDTPCHFHFPIEVSFYPQSTCSALQ